MGATEWKKLCQKVKSIEEEYAESDHVVDLVTEQFIIRVEESSDDSVSDDSASADDRSSPEPGPSSKRPCQEHIEGVLPLSDSD